MVGVHYTFTVHVPELASFDVWMEKLVEQAQAIKDEVARLSEAQAQGAANIASQLNAILAEMQQYTSGQIPQAQFDNLLASLKTAADTAEKQAADIRANTEKITGIVPDTPPA